MYVMVAYLMSWHQTSSQQQLQHIKLFLDYCHQFFTANHDETIIPFWLSKGNYVTLLNLPEHWKFGISMYHIQELIQTIEADESSGFCHEMPPMIIPVSSLLKISRHLLFVHPINWLALSTMCLKSINWLNLNWINKVLSLKMPPKLAILSQLTNMLSTIQTNCYWVTGKNSPTINFVVEWFFVMLLLVLYWLRIESHLELEKILWLRNLK